MKGVISCAHPATALAARNVLIAGGNAFDGAIAALIVACVSEPCIASFSAGLIGLFKPAGGEITAIDAFAIAPGKRDPTIQSELLPIEVDFIGMIDLYYYGRGSVAATGYFKAILELLAYANMPLTEHLDYAIAQLKGGVPLTDFSSKYLNYLAPTFISDELKNQYLENSIVHKPETIIRNLGFEDLLATVKAEGVEVVTQGEIPLEIDRLVSTGGHLRREDLINYKPRLYPAHQCEYKGQMVAFSDFPSWGSRIVQDLLQNENQYTLEKYLVQRMEGIKSRNLLATWRDIEQFQARKWGGTGHISIADSQGNVLALSYSLGEGSGLMTPYSGIHLNNMLGEPALFSGEIDSWVGDERLVSMMTPVIINGKDSVIALGSGGSERIPQIMYQVIRNITELSHRDELSGEIFAQAIEKDRIFYKDGHLHLEPDYVVEKDLERKYQLNRFGEKGMFYGGVNGIASLDGKSVIGYADSRRKGIAHIIE